MLCFPSVFLFGLSDGDKIIGEIKIKEGEVKETEEITLILEKESGDSFLHIPSEDWDMNFMKQGRANLKQHFFFFTKRKPVLKEKKTCFFSQAFFLRKVVSQGFYRR